MSLDLGAPPMDLNTLRREFSLSACVLLLNYSEMHSYEVESPWLKSSESNYE